MEMKLMFKVMNKNLGFTIMELMTTIAIIALVAAIAVPNMISWRSGTRLQGAVDNLRGDLQWAKLKAVQENGSVKVDFSVSADNDEYQVSGSGLITKTRQLPPGVRIDPGNTSFSGNGYVTFNNRGFPDNSGTVAIVSSDGKGRTIDLNRLGRIDIN
jgi:type IV fimbrial biogenesis protein FimT